MDVRVGTSGYSYKEWKGNFYPEDLAAKDMLAFYAERLPAVEINNTFYRLPKRSVLETWADAVPEGFRFVLKASRRITHFKRLAGADEETAYLAETSAVLGPRRGPILFQLPPNLKADVDRLAAFLELLPDDVAATFEFRHASWNDASVHERLAARNVALTLADTDEAPITEIVRTADWGYLRLRRPGYDDAALAGWAQRLRDTGWREAYVFFKHEDEGAGPAMAARFAEILAG